MFLSKTFPWLRVIESSSDDDDDDGGENIIMILYRPHFYSRFYIPNHRKCVL